MYAAARELSIEGASRPPKQRTPHPFRRQAPPDAACGVRPASPQQACASRERDDHPPTRGRRGPPSGPEGPPAAPEVRNGYEIQHEK